MSESLACVSDFTFVILASYLGFHFKITFFDSNWIFPGININFPLPPFPLDMCRTNINFPTLMHPVGGWVFVVDVTRG